MKRKITKAAPIGKASEPSTSDCTPFVGTAILSGDLILLARRILVCPKTKEKVKFGGYWSIFCGAVEEGESHYSAAHREVLEETGFNLDLSKFKNIGRVRDLRLYAYEIEELLTPKLDYEHTECGWFKISEILISPSPVDAGLAKRIQDYYTGVI